MLKFYFNGSPNPTKVALFLEETGLPYEPIPVDTARSCAYRAVHCCIVGSSPCSCASARVGACPSLAESSNSTSAGQGRSSAGSSGETPNSRAGS